MVRVVVIAVLVTVLSHSVRGQEFEVENKLSFSAQFSKDTVSLGDTLVVRLFYKNVTTNEVSFSLKANVGVTHYHPNAFISYDSPDRIMYLLSNIKSYEHDTVVSIIPSGTHIVLYNIVVDDKFFYDGNNALQFFFHSFRKDKSTILYGSLWSPEIHLFVKCKR